MGRPVALLFYALVQERATQVTYVNLGRAFASDPTVKLKTSQDPVLLCACKTIALDEASHYGFFLDVARMYMYYFPEEATEALVDVIRHFSMPARHIIPGYDHFGRVLHELGVFGRRQHYVDVVSVALRQLGVNGLRSLEDGVRRSRSAPTLEGGVGVGSAFESLQPDYIETCVRSLFDRIAKYAVRVGVDHTLDASFHRRT